MLIPTLIIIAILAVLLYGLSWVAKELWEFEEGFFYFAFGMMFIIIGVAVYLSYSVPTFAKPPLPNRNADIIVTQDGIDLLPE